MADEVTEEKQSALAALEARRKQNRKRKRVDNSKGYAGEPMHFDCDGCSGDIVVPEDYTPPRRRFCGECEELRRKGWLK